MVKRPSYEGPCPIEKVLGVFSGKWKPSIIFHLEKEGPLRFNTLKRRISEITQRMLTQQLRELERDGIVERIEHSVKPPHVEYRLSDLGKTLGPVGQVLEQWGEANMDKVRVAQEEYEAKAHNADRVRTS